MASSTGNFGVVKVGTNEVAEVNTWSLDETGETVDNSTMGTTAKTHLPLMTSATGSMECFWDPSDTAGQGAMSILSSITLSLYPKDAAVGSVYKTMTATITSIGLSSSKDGMNTANFSFEVNGAITEATV